MALLNETQIQRALEAMEQYLFAPVGPHGETPVERSKRRDHQRCQLIDDQLKPLVASYLSGNVSMDDFKWKVDSLNKQNELWGFKGIKGQMFFNVLVNLAQVQDAQECDAQIKAAIQIPLSEEEAAARINKFSVYVKSVGDKHVDVGGDYRGKPKISSVPFFLSYFWQIQDHNLWPVFYTNSVNTMTDLNLWIPSGDYAADYITFKQIHEKLAAIFSEKARQSFNLYDVEHVFWVKGGNSDGGDKPVTAKVDTIPTSPPPIKDSNPTILRLPDSYVPPIISVLPQMALNTRELQEAAKASGTSLDRAFEKHINAAFAMLGYETKLMGQGNGRVPDGLALATDDNYAILWDAKVRTDGYIMGTDDRAIKEYITTQSRELKRRKSFRNIYYLIISSHFLNDSEDLIRTLKMETDVNEVCLLEAHALVSLVEMKLRDPQTLTLGPDGLQRLFSNSGVISQQETSDVLA